VTIYPKGGLNVPISHEQLVRLSWNFLQTYPGRRFRTPDTVGNRLETVYFPEQSSRFHTGKWLEPAGKNTDQGGSIPSRKSSYWKRCIPNISANRKTIRSTRILPEKTMHSQKLSVIVTGSFRLLSNLCWWIAIIPPIEGKILVEASQRSKLNSGNPTSERR
jgi:hypothetical protein